MENIRRIDDERKGISFFPLFLMELAGVACGSFIAAFGRLPDGISGFIIPKISSGTAIQIFGVDFLQMLVFLILSVMSGCCILGQPLGILLIIEKGAELGFASASVYAAKGFAALPEVFLVHIPRAAGISFIALLSVRELLRMSCSLFHITASRNGDATAPPSLKLFAVKYLILFIGALVFSCADMALVCIMRSIDLLGI
ncbi:MAG: hypothetical protein NC093_10555 [Alistipes sp.]|nr:hypothetical protein [Alistipes sp.]